MSKPQTQTPNSESFSEVPVYTREVLERKLKELNEKLGYIVGKLREALDALGEIYAVFQRESAVSAKTLWKMVDCGLYVEGAVKDGVDEMIIRALGLDVDIAKYEREYNVKFTYESERQLGVALLKSGESVRPAVIWTDYKKIGYYEGEKNE